MKIQTEQDMNDFCEEVNQSGKPFEIVSLKNLPPKEIQSRLVGILRAEPIEKVASYARENRLNELFIQGIANVFYDFARNKVFINETPTIYPSGRAPELEGPMTGVLVNAYSPDSDAFMFHMRGGDISIPFGFQAAAAGFGNFGEHPYDTAKNELKTESGLATPDLTLEKALVILPFMKGVHPQPLFLYGFKFDSNERNLPVIRDFKDIAEFEKKKKEMIANGAKVEAYPFLVPSGSVEVIVNEIYQRDPTQQGKNGGFFGPIKESHEAFIKYL